MTETAVIFMNFALCLILLAFELKEAHGAKAKKTKTKKEAFEKRKELPKTQKSEISAEEKRNFEILDQIQRYDGTRILRKE